jgi:hypothetical protein
MASCWQNNKLRTWLRDQGLEMATDLLTTKALSWYLMDESHLEGTGFSMGDDLTIDHVVPQQLGGPCCIYNFVLMERSTNSHFGKYYSKEKEAFLGSTICAAAENVTKLIRRQGLERAEIIHFDPLATPCPQPTRKRMRGMDQVEEAYGAREDAKTPRWSPVLQPLTSPTPLPTSEPLCATPLPELSPPPPPLSPPTWQEALEQLVPQPTPLQWKAELLQKIARGEVPATDSEDAPKSVRKALLAFADDHGDGCLIFATTPNTYEALGVPDEKGRAYAGWIVHELIRRVPDAEKEVKLNLGLPGGGTKYTWCVLSRGGCEALARAAQESTVGDLNSAVRVRSEQSKRCAMMDALAAQGLHECPECCSPILDTSDPQYIEKDALIQSIGKRGAVLSCCDCGHGVGVRG